MNEYKWQRISLSNIENLPSNAIFAGEDHDGAFIYVGRARHEGEDLPAKVIPSKRIISISYNGKEITKECGDILCGEGFTWVPVSYGKVPQRAVSSKTTCIGESIWIGRAPHQRSLTPGKIHPSHNCIYIPYGGEEIKIRNYEALVYPETWISSGVNCSLPSDAVVGGCDTDGSSIYVGRCEYNLDIIPAKVIPSKNVCFVSYCGREISMKSYDLLCGNGYEWKNARNGRVPSNAVVGGRTSSHEPLFIGRTSYNGSLTIGKIHPSYRCLFIPYGGVKKNFSEYEVLVTNGGL